MLSREAPIVGQWYQSPEFSEIFEVIAIYDDTLLIDLQFVAGEIEEVDMETWQTLRATEIAEPEDWTAPYEIEDEDYLSNYYDEPIHPETWSSPSINLDYYN